MTDFKSWITEQYKRQESSEIKSPQVVADPSSEDLNNAIADCYKNMDTAIDEKDMRK